MFPSLCCSFCSGKNLISLPKLRIGKINQIQRPVRKYFRAADSSFFTSSPLLPFSLYIPSHGMCNKTSRALKFGLFELQNSGNLFTCSFLTWWPCKKKICYLEMPRNIFCILGSKFFCRLPPESSPPPWHVYTYKKKVSVLYFARPMDFNSYFFTWKIVDSWRQLDTCIVWAVKETRTDAQRYLK